MSEPRWTAETEALVAQRIAQDCAARWGYDTTLGEKLPEWLAKQGNGTNTLADVRSALAALADAGLLVQPAAEALAGLRQELDEARAERDRLRTLTSQVDYALRLLVNLKDGPRDEAYARDKPTAWQLAREAVAAVDAYRSATPDAEPAPGVPVDTEEESQ